MTFKAMPLSALIQVLSQQAGRTIVDKTGLTGRYDFTWQFNQGANTGLGGGGASAGVRPVLRRIPSLLRFSRLCRKSWG